MKEKLSIAMLKKLLKKVISGERLQPEEWHWLCAHCLKDDRGAAAFGITSATVESMIQQRIHHLKAVYPTVAAFCDRRFAQDPKNKEPFPQLLTLWEVWLPLALHLAERRKMMDQPFVQGILGGQGTGKTTLGAILTLLLDHLGYRTLSWSLDDLYKTYADRCALQAQDPRLIWRGPPGTHDVALGIDVLDQLQRGTSQPIEIPRFDKSLHNGMGDRAVPELVSNVDIVLFEGWFVGVRPVDPSVFEDAPAPIITESDRAFARDMNIQLQDYLPLWQRLNSLWVLYVPDYQLSKQWRKQAERAMKAAGKPGMSDVEIDTFVDYFWRSLHPELFITSTLNHADLVIEIQPDHSPGILSNRQKN
jgi:D-glycerate 3-kinase